MDQAAAFAAEPLRRARQSGTLLALAILAGGLILRFWGLGDKNLWLDEGASWVTTRSDWPEFWRVVKLDIHPPFYYLLLKGWVAIFGDSAAAMRSLSAIGSVAALWCAWLLARRFLPQAVALAIVGWLAISPHQLFYAQEARMYALAALAVLAGTVAYVRWIDSGGRSLPALTGLVLAATAALYLHYFTALWLACVVLSALLWRPAQGRGAALRQLALGITAIAVLYLPWAYMALTHVVRGQPWRAAVGLEGLPFQLWAFIAQLFAGYYTQDIKLRHGGALALMVAVVGVATLAIVTRRRHRQDGTLLLTLTAGPILLGVAALFRAGAMDLARYLGYILPFVAIGAGRGWTDLLRSTRGAAMVIAISSAALLPATSAYFADPSRDSDIRPLIHVIAEAGGATPASPILVAPGYMSSLLNYYQPTWPFAALDERATLDRLAPGERCWLILDYRLPGADLLAADPRLERIVTPGSRDEKMKLFRTR